MTDPQYTRVRLCTAPGCQKPTRHADPYCSMHLTRLARHGSLDLPMAAAPPGLPGEEWLPVVGFEGVYEVSNCGRVRRVRTCLGGQAGKLLGGKTSPRRPYRRVELRLAPGSPARDARVHQLVFEAFVGPVPPGHEINHINGDKSDCRVSNLEAVTHRGNMEHAGATGLAARGRCVASARLSEDAVRQIRTGHAAGAATCLELAERFGVTESTIGSVVRRETWRHVDEVSR